MGVSGSKRNCQVKWENPSHFGIPLNCRVLKGGGGVQGKGVFLGNPKDSGREDWEHLGRLGESPPPLDRIPLFY